MPLAQIARTRMSEYIPNSKRREYEKVSQTATSSRSWQLSITPPLIGLGGGEGGAAALVNSIIILFLVQSGRVIWSYQQSLIAMESH